MVFSNRVLSEQTKKLQEVKVILVIQWKLVIFYRSNFLLLTTVYINEGKVEIFMLAMLNFLNVKLFPIANDSL